MGLAGVLAVVALGAAGCGAQTHPNDPRPTGPTRVSVTITPRAITVQPTRIAFGPERNQQIPQNRNHAQPPIPGDKHPLTVVIVAANQTTDEVKLELRGPADESSETIPANSPGTTQTDLPTGTYVVAASGVPGARPAKLSVGPYRASSQNDVLTP